LKPSEKATGNKQVAKVTKRDLDKYVELMLSKGREKISHSHKTFDASKTSFKPINTL
jgi:hypothetical protein